MSSKQFLYFDGTISYTTQLLLLLLLLLLQLLLNTIVQGSHRSRLKTVVLEMNVLNTLLRLPAPLINSGKGEGRDGWMNEC